MPEDYGIGYIWDPENGEVPYVPRDYSLYQSGTNPYMYDAYRRWLSTPVYGDASLTDPAVVTAEMPAKFNGDRKAAERYAEGYRWGQENVVQPREKAAPYVAAGLAGAMAAPFAVDLAASGVANIPQAIGYLKETAPLWKQAAGRMAVDLPAFEVADRLPQLWGDDRFTEQGTNIIKQTTPIGRYAPWAVDVVGPFIAGAVPGMAGDMMMRGVAGGVSNAIARSAARRAGYLEPVAEAMAERASNPNAATRLSPEPGEHIRSLMENGEFSPMDLEVAPPGHAPSSLVRDVDGRTLRTPQGRSIRRGTRWLTDANGEIVDEPYYYDLAGNEYNSIAEATGAEG